MSAPEKPPLGSVWRRGKKQVEVLGLVETAGEALRVQIRHWAANGLVTFPKLSRFLREYTRDGAHP